MKQFEVTLALFKETKNTYHYRSETKGVALSDVYISKEQMGTDPAPTEITVAVSAIR